LEDWYELTATPVKKLGGSNWLQMYDNSLIKALKDVYPQIQESNFHRKHPGYWKTADNNHKFVKQLEAKLSILYFNVKGLTNIDIKRMEDWYSINTQTVKENGGSTWLDRYVLRSHHICTEFLLEIIVSSEAHPIAWATEETMISNNINSK
jgi:hypothetical protein